MNLTWIGFGCAAVGALVITLYTVANYRLRRRGAEAVWLGGWILGALGMILTAAGWALLAAAGPHYDVPILHYSGLAICLLAGLLYFLAAVHVGRWRSLERYKLSLHTGGIYRMVRHPQALALCLLAVGVALATLSKPFLLGLPLWIGYWIAYTFFEERFELIPAYGKEYDRYKQATGRLFPSPRSWKRVLYGFRRFARAGNTRQGGWESWT